MFDQLLKLITGDDRQPAEIAATDQRVSVAALLVEAARMDQTFRAEERDTIARLLTQRFELSADEAARLIETADEKLAATAQYFRFTHELNTSLSAAEKIEVIEMLWSVAYADGELDAHEDQLIRQIAGLIHVTDRDRMLARKRALGAG
ncbi:MAG: TerB family tellurite resistance protein [Alphaproteobacteria bacterium]|nr:TerB family tellurite resistance protein [Alphaproteobacteria bacterium]